MDTHKRHKTNLWTAVTAVERNFPGPRRLKKWLLSVSFAACCADSRYCGAFIRQSYRRTGTVRNPSTTGNPTVRLCQRCCGICRLVVRACQSLPWVASVFFCALFSPLVSETVCCFLHPGLTRCACVTDYSYHYRPGFVCPFTAAVALAIKWVT